MRQLHKALILAAFSFPLAFGQAPARLLGTVASVAGESLGIKTESGETVTVQTPPNVKVQKVAPGERDLNKAESITLPDIAAGDRVLVRGSKDGDAFRASSVVVMTAREIAKHDESARKAWPRANRRFR